MKRFGLAVWLVLLSAMALLSSARAIAATAATMTIGESAQGNVKGNKQSKNASPAIVIQLLSVTRPATDVASGAAARKSSSPVRIRLL